MIESTMSKKLGRTQGFFKSMWNYYTKIRPSEKQAKYKIVGTDLKGNQYAIRTGDSDVGRKENRLVIPSEEAASMYMDNLGLNVPQEWDEWLRHRRDDPPTIEELQMNEIKKKKVQEKVRELQLKERLEKEDATQNIRMEAPSSDSSTVNVTKNITGDTRKVPFPVYEDLEKVPGEFLNKPKS